MRPGIPQFALYTSQCSLLTHSSTSRCYPLPTAHCQPTTNAPLSNAMAQPFSASDLEAFLDEALPSDEMARIEKALREDPTLMRRLSAISGRRDAGLHSVGAIWRRHRLSCPTREQLGNCLLGILPQEVADYVRFHLKTVGCRHCQANQSDLERQQAEARQAVQSRRRKYFQSSAGYLRKGRGKG